ncbi:uncharacterized protein LOC110265161 [Arachis ipaensis]|uniref:uncharacterized protein LOC110265161 n=1 Tax=Arachis ipaensis TaxID=130454 RepID=UPI000A2B583A|nr:uncharacterized protein LOC110265161 [Arachis ipaensis]
MAVVAGSSSRPAVASSSVPAYEPPTQPVAFPSFAVDLSGNVGDEVGTGEHLPTSVHCSTPAGVGDGLFEDPDDDDVEPDLITDDSGDDLGASDPRGAAGGSSSGTQQYPPHFSSLDLDAMRHDGLSGQAAGFGVRDVDGSAGMTEFQGDWDESYNEIPMWVLGVQLTMPGSVAVLRTCPVRVGGQLDESHAYFHRMFWMFTPCIEAFCHCKPLDGNSNILHVAFVLVEGENADSWFFFLSHLRQHITPQPGLLVISDRHNGIKAALDAPDGGWLPPAAYRAFCIRHVAANFALTFKGKDARRLLVNAADAKTEVEFDYWFDILRFENPAMCDWANRIEYSLWTQYCDEGRRFGHMMTNISECVNSILKSVRNLPVCSLVKATYGRLAKLFVRKGREAKAQLGTEQQFSQYLVKCIEANLKTARCFTVTVYDRDNSEYIVVETTPTGSFSLGSYRVSLASQTCDCGYFQALHFPCPHALACCAYSRVTWQPYLHQVYRLSSVFSVYRMRFTPPIPEGFWPPYDGPTVIPDPNMRRAREGRSRSTRIRTNMDEADPNRPKRCGLCRQPGHTRRSCPQTGGPSHAG